MWKKPYTLITAISILVVTVAAVEAEIPAGTPTVIDSNLTENTGIESVEGVLEQIELEVNGTNLVAEPSFDLSPGEYEGTVEFEASEQSYTVAIEPTVNWNSTQTRINETLETGETGEIENLSFTYQTNVQQPGFQLSFTEEIKQYINMYFVEFASNNKSDAYIEYEIPENTNPGNRTGNTTVTTVQDSHNISTVFEIVDRETPEIHELLFNDVPAFEETTFKVDTTDNVGVANVSAEIFREEDTENGTSLETFYEANFTRENENTTLWTYDFTETSDIENYQVEITVKDDSGNVNRDTASFDVESFKPVELFTDNFEFDAVNPGNRVEEKVFELETDYPVTLNLESVSHPGSNSTVDVGIRHEDDSAPETFDGDSIRLDDDGEYYLTLVSGEILQSLSGRISVEGADHHDDINDIVFSGQVINPEYPEPEEFSIGQFRGNLSYVNPDNVEKETMVFEGTAPADNCRGFTEANQCISEFSLNEIPQIKEDIDSAISQRNWMILITILVPGSSILFVLLYMRRRILECRIIAAKPVKTEDFDKNFTDKELQEYGVTE